MILHEYLIQACNDETNVVETEATFLNRSNALSYMEQAHSKAMMDTTHRNGTIWTEGNGITYRIEDWILTVDPSNIDVKNLEVVEC